MTSKLTVAALFALGWGVLGFAALPARAAVVAEYSCSAATSTFYGYYQGICANVSGALPSDNSLYYISCPAMASTSLGISNLTHTGFSIGGSYVGNGFYSFNDSVNVGTTTITLYSLQQDYSCGFGTIFFTDTSSTPPAAIAFSYPTDGSSTPPFYYWQLETTNVQPGSSTPIVIVSSELGATDTLSFSNQDDDGALFNFVSSTQQIPANLTPSVRATSTYYAEAGIFYPGSSTPIATTGIISFTLDFNASTTQNPAGTIQILRPTNGQQGTCYFTSAGFFSDPIGNIKQAFCSIFIPSTVQQIELGNSYGQLGTMVANKPPFGYFALFSAPLTSINATSTPSSTPILDASATAMIATTFTGLDGGTAAILWLMFGIWGFHRARLIQL